MWTPSSLMSSDLLMGRPSRLSTASLVSLGLILGNWNLSGLADKRLLDYHIRACLLLVFICCLTISWFVPLTCNWWSSAYVAMFPFSTCNGKSFWTVLQSKGPKDDPCGHPRFIGFQMPVISPSFTLFRLFSKNDRVKSRHPRPKTKHTW